MARKTTVIIKQMARNNVIAEFSCGDHLFGILSYKKGVFSIEIYPPPGDKWELDIEDFLALVEQGKQDIRDQLSSRSR
ncbi:hypothetical protein [Candidatus Uabimicrobium amorphum]|uniref:Uncharacterized protein n=1 Tax=Uabimicrobium amorphum TaxID=2596890 RepID=A0A5S9IN58_UABAM|nr:hypothetical protein [Candidatus Uabimicrobium amorphum]BBM84794.1 hypothetical protein UABAM_03155 [Candidatus Uabimicrobium amorphum]